MSFSRVNIGVMYQQEKYFLLANKQKGGKGFGGGGVLVMSVHIIHAPLIDVTKIHRGGA